jgi:hypothetical protein
MKLVVARTERMAEALKIKVPEFANSETRIGLPTGIRDEVKGAIVLTESLPTDMMELPQQVVHASCRVPVEMQDAYEAKVLAYQVSPYKVYSTSEQQKEEAITEW